MYFKEKHLYKRMSLVIIVLIMLCSLLFGSQPDFAAGQGAFIGDVNTDKAKYLPGEVVTIYVDLNNNTGASTTNGTVSLHFKHLEKEAAPSASKNYTLAAGATKTMVFTWTPPSTDYKGYLVEVDTKNENGIIINSATVGVDVSSNWLKFPRYGYVTNYGNSVDTANVVWQLKNYHINALQFYDWQWKHHMPVKGSSANPDSSWKDLSNKEVNKTTIHNYIDAAHNSNMAAMQYNLIYGAVDNYEKDGSGVSKDWGLFDSPEGAQWKMPMPGGWATSALYFFNPLNTDWQDYILNKELDVFSAFQFDGWHADTVGDFGTKYDSSGNPVFITDTFKPFLNYAKSRLGSKLLIMNPVGNKGHLGVNTSKVDAVYTEIWPWDGFPDYNSLKGVVDQARSESGGKSLIVPAYMNYDYAKTKSESSPGSLNTPGVLLTDAAVFAAGGSRLELGDDTRMLCSEYFPNRNLIMSEDLKKRERNYYDFLVAYENLLRDGQSNTTNQVSLSGYASSTNGAGNKVWTFTKKDNGYEIIHMINLLGVSDTSWRDTNADKPAPTKATNMNVKYYHSDTVGTVWLASPDYDNGKSTKLSFTTGSDAGGNYVAFTVPSLEYWDMIYISKSMSNHPSEANNQVEKKPIESKKTFEDVQNHWAKENIELMASKHIVQGMSKDSFEPDGEVTRAQFATMLVNALGIKEKSENAFTDIEKTAWYYDSVRAAAKAGLVNGIEKNKFAPNEKITREQMAAMIMRAYAYSTGKDYTTLSEGKEIIFVDQNKIHDWAKKAVEAANELGIIQGMNGNTFAPEESATRAQAVTMLKRLLEKLNLL